MPDKLGEITGEAMLSGLFPDLPQRQPPVFADGRNVIFTDNSVQPIPGQYVITATSGGSAVRGLLSTRSGSTPILFYGDDSKLYRYTISGGTTEVGSGYSGDGAAWSLQRWGTWVLATNGVNAPQIFKGSAFAALGGISGVFNTAKFFLVYRNHVLAFNTDINDSRIAWCAADDPELWVAALNNTARLLDIRDTSSEITAGIVSGKQIYYWTRRSMSVMGFIGPPFYFSSDPVTKEIGAFGPMSVAEAKGLIWGIGPSGIWTTDGSGYDYIDAPVHDRLFGDINLDEAHKCVVVHDAFTQHVIFWIPGDGQSEVSYGLAFNYREKNWTIRGDARSAAINSGDFDWAIFGDTSGNVYAQSLVGAPVSAQDPDLHIAGSGTASVPLFGYSGFGQGGFGGSFALTE